MIAAALALFAASADACPASNARADLLAIHEAARKAHLAGDSAPLAEAAADMVVLADDGGVRTQSKAEMGRFFEGYFKRIRYLEWKDSSPPEITVSPDGQMAWMAVAIEAKYERQDKPSEGVKSFKSSWIATYERRNCAWRMTGIASNVVQ